MKSMIRNFGPLAAVIAAVGWLCWEHVDPLAATPDLGSTKVVAIGAKLLTPELPPPVARNPLAPVAPPSEAMTPPIAEAIAMDNAAPAAAVEAPQSRLPSPLKLQLRGTYLGGLRKSALIDDRLCFEGDCLPGPAGAADTWRLTQVERDFVVLRIEDQEFRLEYSH